MLNHHMLKELGAAELEQESNQPILHKVLVLSFAIDISVSPYISYASAALIQGPLHHDLRTSVMTSCAESSVGLMSIHML